MLKALLCLFRWYLPDFLDLIFSQQLTRALPFPREKRPFARSTAKKLKNVQKELIYSIERVLIEMAGKLNVWKNSRNWIWSRKQTNIAYSANYTTNFFSTFCVNFLENGAKRKVKRAEDINNASFHEFSFSSRLFFNRFSLHCEKGEQARSREMIYRSDLTKD